MTDHTAEDLEQAAVRYLLDQTLAWIMERLSAHIGAVYLAEPGGEVLSLEVASGAPPEWAKPLQRLSLTAAIPSPTVDAVRERRLVWIGSGEDYARRYPQILMLLPYPYATAFAPLATGTTVWGAMVLVWPHGRPPELSRVERHTIGAAADRLTRLLEDTAEAGHPLVPAPEPRYLPPAPRDAEGPAEDHAVVDFVTRLPEGGCALDPEGRITFIDRTAADLVGESIPRLLGARLWEALSWLGEPGYEHQHRDTVISQRPTSFTATRPAGGCLLFQLYPDPTGVSVRITTTRPEHRPPDPRPSEARSAEPTRPGAIYHLMHVAAALTETVDVHDVVEVVADQLLLAFDAQAFALLVPEAGRVQILGARGFTTEWLRRLDHRPLTADTPGIPGLATGTPSFFASRKELTQASPAQARADDRMAAWAFLPLAASGQPVGTCVLGYDQPHPFTTEERLTLTTFGTLIAQALDRARLYDAKHQLAHGLQARLLPRNLPKIPCLDRAARYLPASHGMDIGGDFYDLIRMTPTEVAAVIGDVQGHNVRAAALMGQVRSAVHAHAVAGAAPGDILARTNRLLTDLDPDLLTSCLYAHLDLAHHRARLATAGHHPPLVRHPDLHTEILPVPPGPLLGADPTAAYPTTDVALHPGTVLAFYTDGLIEAPGTHHDSNLTSLITALSQAGHQLEDIADTLIDQAQPSDDRTDDTALLLLRIEPAPRAST
ncbi:PP2C family protein-serine/threonine phosphatase [Streptomyces sp. NPDC002888]|uniref:PP2C family protein-serine/threonine phosphatase n=1 Tax=Streptomyces sp. NPDC002888 TaxID=3364668 RepID=UPI0036A211FC